jgi:hypothetical protein
MPPLCCRLSTLSVWVAWPWAGLVGGVPHGACIAGKCYGMPGVGAGVFYAPFCRRAFSLRKLRRIKKGGVDELGKPQ